MRKSRYTEEQIIGFVRQAEGGRPVAELCRREGFSSATFYKLRAKYAGVDASEARPPRELEAGMLQGTGISERRACALVGLSRDSWRHPRRRAEADLSMSERITQLAHERRRFGYRRIADLIRAGGEATNDKRVYPKAVRTDQEPEFTSPAGRRAWRSR